MSVFQISLIVMGRLNLGLKLKKTTQMYFYIKCIMCEWNFNYEAPLEMPPEKHDKAQL